MSTLLPVVRGDCKFELRVACAQSGQVPFLGKRTCGFALENHVDLDNLSSAFISIHKREP